MTDKTYNAADENAVAEQARKAKRRDDMAGADFRDLMGRPEFRRFLWRLLSDCEVFRASFVPGIDALSLAYAEGRRNLGRELLAEVMRLSPEDYLTMLVEAQRDA
jgi:hypothetical protein